jgi:hypothetical protein
MLAHIKSWPFQHAVPPQGAGISGAVPSFSSMHACMQRTPNEAAAFCNRKIQHVKKQLDEIGDEINSKSSAIKQINEVMLQRSRESEASAAAATARNGSA